MLRRTVLLGLLAAVLVPASADAAVSLVKVGTFSGPVYVTAPPGDGHRLFVVEQGGRIQLMVDGQKQATPFLDISSRVTASGEQGLLSMAFAPDYGTSGRFYVYYTSKTCPASPGCDEHVSEFTRSASNPNVADPASERPLLDIPHPNQSNHNGGQLQFGPDGDLYISTGDGGGANDTGNNAQHTTNLLGKILRIDPLHGSPYSIPSGNPFTGGGLCVNGSNGGSNCPEIWSYGLRNPWRFSFDRATGDLVIGDVGQGAAEEIDYAHPGQNVGANYGWPCYEGTVNNSGTNPTECSTLPSPVVMPVHEYFHSGSGFTGSGIIGGYVVRDQSLSDLYGRYVYGDLASTGLRSLALGQPNATDDRAEPLNVSSLSSFGEDSAGCVYAASVGNGGVWRLAPSTTAGPGPCPLTATSAPPTDKTPPTISLSLRRRQRILRTRAIRLTIRVSERASVAATATVNVGHAARVLRFKRTTRTIAANKRVTMRLKLSNSTLKKLRTALRHKRSFLARVTVTARDSAGNPASKRRAVRLVR